MLDILKFCAGAVGKKEFVPGMTHFTIEDSKIRAYNGVVSICGPINMDINCSPNAEALIKAVSNCEDSIKLTLTPAGKLSVKSGSFKALIPCIAEPAPKVDPEGVVIEINGEAFMKGIKAVAPFIGSDASRLWSHGILIKDASLFATNNIILVQYWLGINFPFPINIPHKTIKEMIRIGENPTSCMVHENSITFFYENDRWLRTQLYSTEWPDLLKILNVESSPTVIDENIFKALEAVKPFVDKTGSIYFKPGLITTQQDNAEDGAEYVVDSLQNEGRFHIEMLQLLDGNCTHIDWQMYPAPCAFMNGMMRGVIIGMRL